MIKISETEDFGWEAAIHGMRNPMNSWDNSDSYFCTKCINQNIDAPHCPIYSVGKNQHRHFFNGCYIIGENDLKLTKSLSKAGDDHGKFLRMINVTMDITAPLYWWKEFDTYKVGTVSNSCSTMHKIQEKEFTFDDFSHEHILDFTDITRESPLDVLANVISELNYCRKLYLKSKDKRYWWQMIQLLPSSYNQKRTIQLNYQVLKTMYHARKNHKLDEWREFCKWCESLPYFKEICIEI